MLTVDFDRLGLRPGDRVIEDHRSEQVGSVPARSTTGSN